MSRRCVRQAAGHGRLAACGPRIFTVETGQVVYGGDFEKTMDAPALTRATAETKRPGSAIPATGKKFCLILLKPSHYDDEGYVIQWLRSTIPSNSLAALYGLARDCRQRHVLGEDVEIEIHPFDETNTRIRPERLAQMIQEAGDGMVMFVGVQSNQFPHALDLAKPLLARGVQMAIGGFHVSGTMSMLGGNDIDVHRAKAMG